MQAGQATFSLYDILGVSLKMNYLNNKVIIKWNPTSHKFSLPRNKLSLLQNSVT